MITPEIIFKQAQKTEALTIRNIALKAWIPTYKKILSEEQLNFMFEKWYNIAELESLIENKSQNFIIEFYNGKPIGFAAYSKLDTTKYKLNKIYILPDFQGKKLGGGLLLEIEKTCKQKGAKILQLNVNRYNKAKDFYLAMNYIIVAEEDIPIGNYFMNDYIMEKNLE
jgi:ribosomal protein S18 acetylase RimI-like enzyme